jgi:2-polyprenyl-6-methoxyphenol hydroxylase-like FAD-dependent oxidoreductase
VKGTNRLLGLLPSGRAPDSSTRVASLFWSIRLDTVNAFRSGKIDVWKQEVISFMPEAAPLLDQIHTTEDLLVAEYHDVRMPHWHGENVVWLGDAAHATSPQLGQGCNLALVDALELASCLERNEHLPMALSEYSRRRRAHLTYYQFMTRALTPFFQSDHHWLGPIRDLLFGLTCRMPILGRQMLLGMAGIHRGPFRRTMPLPELPFSPPFLDP